MKRHQIVAEIACRQQTDITMSTYRHINRSKIIDADSNQQKKLLHATIRAAYPQTEVIIAS
mgnify:FL=1